IPGAKSYLSNPVPTPELIAIVSKVVAGARSRVGKKKGGAEDNSCKEHARVTFYRMLDIKSSREVRPWFEDSYGDPDTLPAQFADPDTKYVRPYPHWKLPLTKQVIWVPTYILRFRATIPNDESELSKHLRGLSDEVIVTLLNDGPFKSGSTGWRDGKKTDLEIEELRSHARRYQRGGRKSIVRARNVQDIPSLQGPEYEYFCHPGYVSPDESDSEGNLITKRPRHRAQWENNVVDAIYVAECEKAKAKPGLCPRFPPRIIEITNRPLPLLERGIGSAKVIVRIALCGISKTWCHDYPDEFRKNPHLINMRETDKPDTSMFLVQHPMASIDNDEYDNGSDGSVIKSEEAGSGTKNAGFGTWTGLNYEGNEESGAVLEMGGSVPKDEVAVPADGTKASEPAESPDTNHTDNALVDPQLMAKGAPDGTQNPLVNAVQPALMTSGDHSGPQPVAAQEPVPMHDTQRLAQEISSPARTIQDPHVSSRFSDMPPPPLLNPNPDEVTSQATGE
ncbi:hypothetical protein FRC07_013350, partial [Ceratobasidium sp. 392]